MILRILYSKFVVFAGLGKDEQGLSTCLQVEKTSKRGGKIINKDRPIPSQALISGNFCILREFRFRILINTAVVDTRMQVT